MDGIRSELHYHSPEQVTEHLRHALRCFEEAEVPTELREVIFPDVLRLLANKHVQVEAVQAGGLDLSRLRGAGANNDLRG